MYDDLCTYALELQEFLQSPDLLRDAFTSHPDSIQKHWESYLEFEKRFMNFRQVILNNSPYTTFGRSSPLNIVKLWTRLRS
jgi:hypothetical protein